MYGRAQIYGHALSITIVAFLSMCIGRNLCINVINVGFEEVGYAYSYRSILLANMTVVGYRSAS